MNKLEKNAESLSPRELEICSLIRNGYTSKEIAGILNISPETVRTQRKKIRKKLGLIGQKTNLISYLKKGYGEIQRPQRIADIHED
jgi:DNA-binding CsgD family transcriptional regulator